MRRSHGPFRPSGVFFRLQFSADYTITMFGFDFRHGQGMPAAAAADMDADFARERRESAFERADHARGNPRGMPVHPHHGAEGLKPERMGETAQEFVAAVIMRD